MPISKIQANSIADTAIHGRRNIVTNGGMQIWQRATSFSGPQASGNFYTADRYGVNRASDVTGLTVSRSTDAPSGFQYSMKLQRDASNTGTQGSYIFYSFENADILHLAGQSVTLSFYAKAGADFSPSNSAILARLDTAAGSTDQRVYNYSSPTYTNFTTSQTLTTSWVRYNYTVTVPSNATQMGFLIYSANYSGTAGADDSWYITGIQLEAGNLTPFEHRSFEEELDRCKRYYQKSFAYGTAPANDIAGVNYAIRVGGDSTVYGGARVNFEKTMRATPAATAYNPQAAPANSGAYLNDIQNGSTTTQYAVTSTAATTDSLHFYVGGFNQGGNDFGCNWTADAEL